MNCSEARYYTPLKLSGELEGALLHKFDAHLFMCPSCRESFRNDTDLDISLRNAADERWDCGHEEVRARVETELKQLQEPYRTTVILRDIEEMSYEQIAEVMGVSLGTVKSRLVRGRDGLRKRLERYAREMSSEVGLRATKKRVGAEPHTRIGSDREGNREVKV